MEDLLKTAYITKPIVITATIIIRILSSLLVLKKLINPPLPRQIEFLFDWGFPIILIFYLIGVPLLNTI